jgi:hypothetical protein
MLRWYEEIETNEGFVLTDLADTTRDVKVVFQDDSSRMMKLDGKTMLRP